MKPALSKKSCQLAILKRKICLNTILVYQLLDRLYTLKKHIKARHRNTPVFPDSSAHTIAQENLHRAKETPFKLQIHW